MTKLLPLALAAFALPLAACNQNKAPEVVDSTAPDPMAAELANRAPVELPPAILAQTTQRCADGSLVYVDFFQGDKQVLVRTEKDGTPTVLKAPEAGQPYVAEGGWKLTGSDSAVEVTTPQGSKSCHT